MAILPSSWLIMLVALTPLPTAAGSTPSLRNNQQQAVRHLQSSFNDQAIYQCCSRDDCHPDACTPVIDTNYLSTAQNCYAGPPSYLYILEFDPADGIAERAQKCEPVPEMTLYSCCTNTDCNYYSCSLFTQNLDDCSQQNFPFYRVFDPDYPYGPATPDGCLDVPEPSSPVHPGIRNDPHITSWNGTMFDWQGECDVVFLQAPHFHQSTDDLKADDVSLDIHVRTKSRYDYSFIETAVIRIGTDTLEVSSFGDYSLNGIGKAEFPAKVAGFEVTHSQPDEKRHVFTIHLGGEEHLLVSTFKDWVSVSLDHSSSARFHGSRGMLGEFGGSGRLLARDGITVVDDPNALAGEWQVRPDKDGLLFQSVRAPQFPEQCRLPNVSAKQRRLGESKITVKAAAKACNHLTAQQREACVLDVMATGDLDIASIQD